MALASLAESAPERVELTQSLEAAERAASLTRQLLTFARRQVTIPTCVDLAEALLSLEPLLARLIGEHIELCVLTNAETWPVDIDPVQLEQVLSNLVVNGIHACDSGGSVEIACGTEAEPSEPGTPARAYLRVSDDGKGMDERTQARIFEPFFTTKDIGQGTGLGLSVAHGIVIENGGSISVKSAAGQGSTFSVFLPAVSS